MASEPNCRTIESPDHKLEPHHPAKPRRSRGFYVPKPACMRSQSHRESFDLQFQATHMVVMVNGLIGSAGDWRYAAGQFIKTYPGDVIVLCSKSNPTMLTFDGVDNMGERLAQEVISVVSKHPNLRKISFIGHSLGGLVSRYAIARLFTAEPVKKLSQSNGECRTDESGSHCLKEGYEHKIAGLEPVNFITVAAPHLGSRGHKQVPVFCGFQTLENFAARSSWILGRTGKHLFLTDCDDRKPPLLLQMSLDTEELKFISALRSFKRRVAYANASFDRIPSKLSASFFLLSQWFQIYDNKTEKLKDDPFLEELDFVTDLVGWSTSSLRRPNELPKHGSLSRHQSYRHIINIEAAKPTNLEAEASSDNEAGGEYDTDVEEVMLRRLTRLSWERVDVNFRGSKQRFVAHSTIQVKSYCINSDGADVIQHMIDHFHL